MQRANNTAAKLLVAIAAAVVANAESYSKSFSAQRPTAAAETTVWYVRMVVSQSCSKPSEHMVSHKVVSFGTAQETVTEFNVIKQQGNACQCRRLCSLCTVQSSTIQLAMSCQWTGEMHKPAS